MAIPGNWAELPLEERAQWVVDHPGEVVDLIRQQGESPAPEAPLAMKVTTVRLPEPMLAQLDNIAGSDPNGRSGLVRQAVSEWLERRAARIAELKEAA
jgi:hypothetical protein